MNRTMLQILDSFKSTSRYHDWLHFCQKHRGEPVQAATQTSADVRHPTPKEPAALRQKEVLEAIKLLPAPELAVPSYRQIIFARPIKFEPWNVDDAPTPSMAGPYYDVNVIYRESSIGRVYSWICSVDGVLLYWPDWTNLNPRFLR